VKWFNTGTGIISARQGGRRRLADNPTGYRPRRPLDDTAATAGLHPGVDGLSLGQVDRVTPDTDTLDAAGMVRDSDPNIGRI
jgi:hypothetical protein